MTELLHRYGRSGRASLAVLAIAAGAAGVSRIAIAPHALPLPPGCDADNAGLTLPAGFCAGVYADSVRGARHMFVAPNGDLLVSTVGGRRGGVVLLRDANHTGRGNIRSQFAVGFTSSEVAVFDGHVYAENGTGIVRFPYAVGDTVAAGAPDTIVSGMPGGGDHPYKTFVIAPDGSMYVNAGSGTNACQPVPQNRRPSVPGEDPCTQLDTRAGIWKFDARKTHQTQATGEHYARGIRNSVAITVNPADHKLWVMQHGRDDVGALWPNLGLTQDQNAELPAEELFQVNQGDDFGWPYCYFDPFQKKKILAPEYGGDAKQQGRCSSKKSNVAFFPAHWAPNGLMFYTGSSFPARYKDGAFIAFHGSWDRAPLPQAGFRIAFQPLKNGAASGAFETFADNFAPVLASTRNVAGAHRPVGMAVAPDGAMYVSDDAQGRIYRIQYVGK